MSSDSEDDCYGNIAQKLQLMKNKYSDDNIQTNSLLDYSCSQKDTPKAVTSIAKIIENSTEIACEEIKDDSGCEEISLDSIIAQNSKNKATRRSKRIAAVSTDNILTTRTRKRLKPSEKCNETIASVNLVVTQQNVSELSSSAETSDIQENTRNARRNSRGRGWSRGRRGGYSTNNTTTNSNTLNNSSISTVNNVTEISSLRNSPYATRGRRRGRLSNTPSRRRGQRMMIGYSNQRGNTHSYPTYSVGNTDEYPDDSHNQPLFSNKNQSKKDEVVVVSENYTELNDSLDENEELSVKVFWQNHECVKFKIRRFQKLRSVFDFFADRENVSHDKLFFTYNDKILKQEDTPDSISYSIVKFIDGGIINQSVSTLVCKDNQIAKDGIKLKFQCQNLKKPYETYLRLEDSMAMALIQCAEYLEKPLDKLKFLFDGDIITGNLLFNLSLSQT